MTEGKKNRIVEIRYEVKNHNQGGKMRKVTITNNFHKTTASFMAPEELTDREAFDWLYYRAEGISPFEDLPDSDVKKSRRIYRRVEKELCGMKDCQCDPFSRLNYMVPQGGWV